MACVYCGARRIELGCAGRESRRPLSTTDTDASAPETCEECEDVLYRYFSSRSLAGTLAERLASFVGRIYGMRALLNDPDVAALFPDPAKIPEVAASMEESEALAAVIRSIGRPTCIWIGPHRPLLCAASYVVFVAGASGLELFEVDDSTALRPWFDRDVAAAQDFTPDGRPL